MLYVARREPGEFFRGPIMQIEDHDGCCLMLLFSDHHDASDGAVINALVDWEKE